MWLARINNMVQVCALCTLIRKFTYCKQFVNHCESRASVILVSHQEIYNDVKI